MLGLGSGKHWIGMCVGVGTVSSVRTGDVFSFQKPMLDGSQQLQGFWLPRLAPPGTHKHMACTHRHTHSNKRTKLENHHVFLAALIKYPKKRFERGRTYFVSWSEKMQWVPWGRHGRIHTLWLWQECEAANSWARHLQLAGTGPTTAQGLPTILYTHSVLQPPKAVTPAGDRSHSSCDSFVTPGEVTGHCE